MPTGQRRGSAEEHQRRLLVPPSEQFGPGGLRVVEHVADLDDLGLFGGCALNRPGLDRGLLRHRCLLLQDRRDHVPAEHQAQDEQQQKSADAHRRPARAHAHATAILDVTALLTTRAPAQRPTPCRVRRACEAPGCPGPRPRPHHQHTLAHGRTDASCSSAAIMRTPACRVCWLLVWRGPQGSRASAIVRETANAVPCRMPSGKATSPTGVKVRKSRVSIAPYRLRVYSS